MSSRQFFQVQPRAKYVAATTSARLVASVLLTFPSRNILEEKTARVTASGQAPVSISKIINQRDVTIVCSVWVGPKKNVANEKHCDDPASPHNSSCCMALVCIYFLY